MILTTIYKESDIKETLLKALEEERNEASAIACNHFRLELTREALDSLAKKYLLEQRSGGSKEEVAESYRVQYVFKRLIERRQAIMKTKKKTEVLRPYLPWYRVLFASYRRLEYMSLSDRE